MSEELVNIEVNGIPLKARKGAMLIEITDAAGIAIPRFPQVAIPDSRAGPRQLLRLRPHPTGGRDPDSPPQGVVPLTH